MGTLQNCLKKDERFPTCSLERTQVRVGSSEDERKSHNLIWPRMLMAAILKKCE